jgi:hypothetical protein
MGPQTPRPQASVTPPLGSKEGSHTRLRGGWGDPIQTTGQTLWYSVVIPLRGEPLPLLELTGGVGKDPSEWPVKTPGLFLYIPLRFLSLHV